MKKKLNSAHVESNTNLSAINPVRFDPSQRMAMIEIAAYFRWEKRNKMEKDHLSDWLESESEIDRHLVSFSS
jgi:hypothetical protein